ncbi:MAG: biotin/lipoyl-binding protein [Desulfobacterales bacterium]
MNCAEHFSGTLESRSEFVVAPKVTGRVKRLYVDIGDVVTPDQVIAELDNDEYLQAVAQAAADLSVAKANRMAAEKCPEIAALELNRFKPYGRGGWRQSRNLMRPGLSICPKNPSMKWPRRR